MSLTATVFTDLAGLAGLQPAWQALSKRVDGNVDFFASYDWTHAYLTHYQPPDWFVVAIFDKASEQLRAVFPLQRFLLNDEAQQFSACKALALPYLPYTDFLLESYDRRVLVNFLLNDVLRLHLKIDLIFFWPLHEDSKLYLTLIEDLGGNPALKTERYPNNLHHIDGRSQCLADYVGSRPKHVFKKKNNYLRRLAAKGSISLGSHTDLLTLEATVKQLCDWNQTKFEGQHAYARFADWPDFLTQLTRKLLPLGRAELTTLRLDGQLIGAMLCFIHKKRRCFFMGDYDPRFKAESPSKILLSHLVEKTFSEGGVFCMGAGSNAYKRDWVQNVGEIKSAIVFLNPDARTVLEPHLTKAGISRITGF